mmetsp:Transcript_26582/g.76596  ORF Transcript_26582/g.76596 Transcript_26582/m.76596 type:complete len:236 (+) Transcript_26582:1067-1774(+)
MGRGCTPKRACTSRLLFSADKQDDNGGFDISRLSRFGCSASRPTSAIIPALPRTRAVAPHKANAPLQQLVRPWHGHTIQCEQRTRGPRASRRCPCAPRPEAGRFSLGRRLGRPRRRPLAAARRLRNRDPCCARAAVRGPGPGPGRLVLALGWLPRAAAAAPGCGPARRPAAARGAEAAGQGRGQGRKRLHGGAALRPGRGRLRHRRGVRRRPCLLPDRAGHEPARRGRIWRGPKI